MNPILRNILAVVAAFVLGGAMNMGLILLGSAALPPPPGVDVNDPVAVAPLTPKVTAAIGPELIKPVASGGSVSYRVDYSYRDEMFGEPTSDPGRFTRIASRDLVNFDVTYHAPDGRWSLGLYGRNAFDERYDNARLNTGDYILVMLNNDASEFGLHYTTRF